MRYKQQTEKEIREAYIFLREKNHTIPSETLQFMLDASLEKLNSYFPKFCCNKCFSPELYQYSKTQDKCTDCNNIQEA